jgi:hypothetical protein
MESKNNKLKLVRVNNPFNKQDNETLERDYFGESISVIVGDVLPEIPCRVLLNGEELHPDYWKTTFLKENDHVVISPNIGKDNQILQIVAIVVIAVASYGVGGYVAGAAWGGKALGVAASAAVNIAGGMLMNMAFAPDTPDSPGQALGDSYSWNPIMTQQQGVPISQIYGEMAIPTGNVVSAYRDLSGDSPELYSLVSYGRGPIRGFKDIRINDQEPLPEDEISFYPRLGNLDQSVIPGFNLTRVEQSPNAALTVDAGTYELPIPMGTEGLEVDISFPSGCYTVDEEDGDTEGFSASFYVSLYEENTGSTIPLTFGEITKQELEPSYDYSYGEFQDGAWIEYSSQPDAPTKDQLDIIDVEHPNAFWRYVGHLSTVLYAEGYSSSKTVSYATRDFVAFTLKATKINPEGSYILRARRTNDDTTRGASSSYLASIRSITNSAFTYPRTALLGVHGIASEKYSGRLQITPTVNGRLIRVWNGSSWSVEYSTNPAWVCYDILTQPIYDNNLNVLRYDGTDPSRMNLGDFYEWAQECDKIVPDGNGGFEKLFEFNGIFDGTSSVWESAVKIANNFRANLYWNGVECRCSVHKKVSAPVQVFSEGNISKGSFKESFSSWEDRATEIEVTFKDRDKDWEQTTLTVIDPELVQNKNKVNITAFGTTKASQAWRVGKYLLANNKYIHRTITFDADIDAIDCVVGDVIAFQHNIPNWGHGGTVKYAINGSPSEVVIEGIGSDDLYSQLGFSQSEIDSFDESTNSIINNNTDTGVLFQSRRLDGTYYQISIYGGGVRNGNTVLQLQSGYTWDVVPSKGDPYAVSLDSFTSTKLFRVSGITQEADMLMSITAIEYIPELFDEVDETDPDVSIEIPSQKELFPPVYNISSADYVRLDSSNTQVRDLYLSWSIPDSNYYSHSKVYWRTRTPEGIYGEWKYAGEYYGRSADIREVKESKVYQLAVVTVNVNGDEAIFSLSPTVTHYSTAVVDYTNPILLYGVKNLRVENSTGDNVTFQETDCHLVWDGPASDNFNTAFSGAFSRRNWKSEEWLKFYHVNIYDYDSNELVYSTTTKIPYFDYTLALNQQNGLLRKFTVGVIAEAQNDSKSPEIFISPYNPQAGQVVNVDTDLVFEGLECWWDKVNEYALSGYEIHVSQTQGFTPNESTLYTTTDKDTLSTMLYLPEGVWYVRVGAFDVFGRDDIAYSTEIDADVIHDVPATQINAFFEEISKLYKVPVLEGDAWTAGSSNLSWNQHTLYFEGVKYTINSGSSSNPYIYWNEGSSSYSSTFDKNVFDNLDRSSGQWQIAKYYASSQSFELAFNAQANAVIGTAMIGDAAIENAKIGDVIQSKDYSYIPGQSASGWKIDKNGDIIGTGISILNDSGEVIFSSSSSIEWNSLSGKPLDEDLLNSYQLWQEVSGTGKPADNADVTNYEDYRVTNRETDNSVTTISNPQGGSYSSSGDTGAIVVTLPQSWTNTMLKMEIDVFNYSQNKSFKVQCGGYTYAGGPSWFNEFAQILGSVDSNNRVRFGHDGSKCCIVIGDTTTSWNYPKISVKNFQAGHSNYTISQWETGWNVSIVSSLTGYTFTGDFSDALLDAKSVLDQGAFATMSQIPALVDGNTTYIAAAAIKDAHIGNLNASKINAGTITGRTFRTSPTVTSSGGVIVTSRDNGDNTDTLFVYDSNGTVRVKLGEL